MENASKALIMAGGILIAIILFSIFAILVGSGGEVSNTYDKKIQNDQLLTYNAGFEKYQRKSSTSEYLLASDIVTVINRAYDINKKGVEADYITISITVPDKEGNINQTYIFDYTTKPGDIGTTKTNHSMTIAEFLNIYSETEDIDEINTETYSYGKKTSSSDIDKKINYKYKFECTQIGYSSSNGKVNSMVFKCN